MDDRPARPVTKRIVKAKDLPIVMVTWEDAACDPDADSFLDDARDFGGLQTCDDVGFLVRKTKREVVLAVSRTVSDDTVRCSVTIPARWVKRIVYLRDDDPRP